MSDAKTEAGFSYVDVMIAVTILLVGIMAMLSAITSAVVMTTTSQQALAAKQHAQSTVETIFAARDLDRLGFDAIGNVGDAAIPGAAFLTGWREFYTTVGSDGIIGTADDAEGPDHILGTGDDTKPVDGFLRQITITNVPDPNSPGLAVSLRQIDVTISYKIGKAEFQEKMTTYAANYRTKDE